MKNRCQIVAKSVEISSKSCFSTNLLLSSRTRQRRCKALISQDFTPSLSSDNFHYLPLSSNCYNKLENRLGAIPRGFESLFLRQKKPAATGVAGFFHCKIISLIDFPGIIVIIIILRGFVFFTGEVIFGNFSGNTTYDKYRYNIR